MFPFPFSMALKHPKFLLTCNSLFPPPKRAERAFLSLFYLWANDVVWQPKPRGKGGGE